MSKPDKIKITAENWASLKLDLADKLLKASLTNDKVKKAVEPYETIYHYTSFEGLIGILESQNLYATNINFLNDRKELKHGIGLIQGVLNSFETKKESEKIIEFLRSNLSKISETDRYVTCFSRNGDLLSQWRSYGNNGKGVAIGFCPFHIEESIYDWVDCMNIMYNELEQIEVLEEYIKISLDYFNGYKELLDWEGFDYDYLVADTLIYFLEAIIANFKHPSFREEEEFRIEYRFDGNINKQKKKILYFRNSNNLIVPYIKLISRFKKERKKGINNSKVMKHTENNLKLPIKEIILGPSLDFELNKIGLGKLLLKTGYEHIEIKDSKIPYRI
ncbi:DUF2971 domain-containing protein [Ulvibacterium marinum]|uniref:DUF2971 domain-containing protein n=1 Tax=Ulvibacterium marinum TaxID=2419782 RepID=A0A3B0CFM0_9FLAO|nr:DUF2971 domain-containing protein [Ulvibacterium marinum]RKN83484.1 DUF2971 domain-containing protein [Ulvibacterium marinum]